MSPVHPAQTLGEIISYASHDRIPSSNKLTSNPVNPGRIMSCCNHVHPAQALG